MTKTENYQLNQWESSDRVLMEDFNEDNRKLDSALQSATQKINEITVNGPKIAFGSYVGTGTYGSDNPNRLTFPFTPKLVLISNSQAAPRGRQGIVGWFYGYNSGAADNDYNTETLKLTWSENLLEWYTTTTNSQIQLNQTDITYYFCAIG